MSATEVSAVEQVWNRARRWRLAVLVLLYVLVLGYFAAAGLYEHVRTTRRPSPEATAATAAAESCAPGAVPSAPREPVRLAPRGTQITNIAFGRDFGTQVREFEFALADSSGLLDGATCLASRVGPFVRNDQVESAQLDQRRVTATTAVLGRDVLVTVRMARGDTAFGPSGSYVGTVSIVDPRVERVDIPLTVTLSYPVWRLPVALLLLVLPWAIGYLWLLKGSFRGRDGHVLTVHHFEDYLFSRNGILAVGAGLTSAVVVLSATYLRSPWWGADFADAIGLFGAMFVAFAAAATPVTASGVDRSDPTDRPPPAVPPTAPAPAPPAAPGPGGS